MDLQTHVFSNAVIRAALVAVPVLALGLYLAYEVNTPAILVVFLAIVIGGVIFGFLSRSARSEAIILGLLLFGYLVGNRGFAEISVIRPLFVGEIGLGACAAICLARIAVARETIGLKTVLGRLIFIFCIIGCARLLISFQQGMNHMEALRDFAVVYYAAFFFIAYETGQQRQSRAFFRYVLGLAFAAVAVVAIAIHVDPSIMYRVSIRGTPVLFQKLDLTATFSVAGAFFLLFQPSALRSQWLRRIVILALFLVCLVSISRAALVALLAASALAWIAGRRVIAAYWGAGLVLALMALAVTQFIPQSATTTSGVKDFRDKVLSIVDFSGKFHYSTLQGEYKADDNEFRQTFWKTIVTETTKDSPVIGRGFGYDFLTRFERTYGRGTWEGLRSPHNIFITIYGRMGAIGFVSFGLVAALICRQSIRAARLLKAKQIDSEIVGYYCCACVLLVSATFGVVLEGPMGAVPFWTFVGLAASGMDRMEKQRQSDRDSVTRGEVQRAQPALAGA